MSLSLARLMAAAHSPVASGSVYFLADREPYSWSAVEGMIQQSLGVTARRLLVPAWMLTAIASMAQAYGRVSGKSVMLNTGRVADLIERHWGCDAERARRDLNFAPQTNINDGLQDVIRWYKEQQWL